jgi:hypothetical protein
MTSEVADTEGIKALLISKLCAISGHNLAGEAEYVYEPATAIFRPEIEAAKSANAYYESIFSDGVEFGVNAVLAVLSNPFADPRELIQVAERTRAEIKDDIEAALADRGAREREHRAS